MYFLLSLLSCSECGTVVMNSVGLEGEDKELLYTSVDNIPIRAICVEDVAKKPKEKAFVIGIIAERNRYFVYIVTDAQFVFPTIGTHSGQLIYRRNSWAVSSAHKDQRELFHGTGSSVNAVTWRGNVVAWADASHVRLMEVHSQTAICYLNSPPNIGVNNPFPCSLFWDTDMDLMIGWADSFRQLHLVQTGKTDTAGGSPGGVSRGTQGMLRAKLTADWVADSIICSVSSFDKDHALLLGYIPPSSDIDDDINNIHDDEGHAKDNDKASVELLCVQKNDGQILSADLLPLQTEVDSSSKRNNGIGETLFDSFAPENFRMLSSYTCLLHRSHAAQWSYKTPFQRGGFRNLPPKLFIMTPSDLVTVKVNDTLKLHVFLSIVSLILFYDMSGV